MQRREEIIAAAKTLMPQYEFSITTITKRNDEKKEALVIKSPDGKVAPVVYLEEYEHLSAQEMALRVQDLIDRFSIEQDNFRDTLLSPDFIKDNVRLQLVNTAQNREFLAGKPHFRVGADLSAVFYVPLGTGREEQAKACLNNEILGAMGLDAQELKEAALQNMWEAKQIRGMTEMLTELIGGDSSMEHEMESERILKALEEGNMQEMVVISNRENMDGAATILCSEFAERCNQDIVILPSSCHEVIIIPHSGDGELRDYQKMVEEINRTQVDPRDVLSDNVYVFSAKTKTMSMACDRFGLVPICDDTKLVLGECQVVAR